MQKKYINRLIIAGILGIALLVVHYLGIDRYVTLEVVKDYSWKLQQTVYEHYVLSVISFVMIIIGATIGSIPITVLLTVLAGFLFGPWYGTVYTILGATLGAMVLFIVTRYLVGDFVQERYHKELAVFNQEIDRHGSRYLLIIQLLPFTPTFLVNVLSGLTRLSLWSFTWATALGILPGTVIYTWIGQQLPVLGSLALVVTTPTMLTLVIILIIIILMVFSWGRYPFFILEFVQKIRRKPEQ